MIAAECPRANSLTSHDVHEELVAPRVANNPSKDRHDGFDCHRRSGVRLSGVGEALQDQLGSTSGPASPPNKPNGSSAHLDDAGLRRGGEGSTIRKLRSDLVGNNSLAKVPDCGSVPGSLEGGKSSSSASVATVVKGASHTRKRATKAFQVRDSGKEMAVETDLANPSAKSKGGRHNLSLVGVEAVAGEVIEGFDRSQGLLEGRNRLNPEIPVINIDL